MSLKRLSELKIGEHAKIAYLTEDVIAGKLLMMGCLPGEEVSISRTAPFGDPIAIHISGYLLSMRKREADTIFVDSAVSIEGGSKN